MHIRAFHFLCLAGLLAVTTNAFANTSGHATSGPTTGSTQSYSSLGGSNPSVLVYSRALGTSRVDRDAVTSTTSTIAYDITLASTMVWDYQGTTNSHIDRTFKYGSMPLQSTTEIHHPIDAGKAPGVNHDQRTTHWTGQIQSVTAVDHDGHPAAPTTSYRFTLNDSHTGDYYDFHVIDFFHTEIVHVEYDNSLSPLNLTGDDARNKIDEWSSGGLTFDVYSNFNDPRTLTSAEYSASQTDTKVHQTALEQIQSWNDQHPFSDTGFGTDAAASATLHAESPTRKTFQKVQYYLQRTDDSPPVLIWAEIFTPTDQHQPPTRVIRTWVLAGDEFQSDIFAIDPLAIDPGADGTWSIQLLQPEIDSDVNQDGKIDGSDAGGATPLSFSPNVDDDAPATGGPFEADSSNDHVDGQGDLKDFVPVFLDLKPFLSVMSPADGYAYKLKQADEALNLVYTDLTSATAFDFRTSAAATGYGQGLDKSAATADTQWIKADGIDLFGGDTGSPAFMDKIIRHDGGVILLEARKFSASPLILTIQKGDLVITQFELPLFLAKGEIGVDANRDGEIRTDGTDATSTSSPYRFWLNEGVDGPGSDAEETLEPGSFGTTHDYQKNRIDYKRDLVDWTRLKLSIPKSMATGLPILALNDAHSGLSVRLEWSLDTLLQLPNSIPGLKFVAAVDGTKNYLKDVVIAEQQITGDQGKVIGRVDASGDYGIPPVLWQTSTTGDLEVNLLFEGAAPGKGRLLAVLYDAGRRLGEIGFAHIEIRPMHQLYEHWTANADDTDAQGATISPDPVHPQGSHPAPFEFTAGESGLSLSADPEGNEYILFVHGWRMKPYERRVFAETAAKRLYQLGYRGKFGFFSWPTEWVNLDDWYAAVLNGLADPHHYDRSEVVARTSGNGPLAKLLQKLSLRFGAAHVHVFAHSMGNVTVTEALRALPQDVPVAGQYVACQSAEVASAYENFVRAPDGSLDSSPTSASVFLGGPDRYTYSAPNIRDTPEAGLVDGDNYHKGVASRLGVMANFYNGGDSALSKWDVNQKLKPDHSIWVSDTAYSYDVVGEDSFSPPKIRDLYQEDPFGILGLNQKHELHWDVTAERHRILAHIVQARSRAAGATKGIKGEFQGTETNLSDPDYSFAGIHSAEFLGDPTSVRRFYQRLMLTFRLTAYETN